MNVLYLSALVTIRGLRLLRRKIKEYKHLHVEQPARRPDSDFIAISLPRQRSGVKIDGGCSLGRRDQIVLGQGAGQFLILRLGVRQGSKKTVGERSRTWNPRTKIVAAVSRVYG